MNWFKRLSSGNRARAVRELQSLPPAAGAAAKLEIQADRLARFIDPDRETLERFTVRETRINGHHWLVVDDLMEPQPGCSKAVLGAEKSLEAVFVEPEKAALEGTRANSFFNMNLLKTPVGIKCPKPASLDSLAMTDKEIGNQTPKEYFGLSENNGVIVRFNVVEYRPRKTRRFAKGIDYPGKLSLNSQSMVLQKVDSSGVEAKEVELSAFMQILRGFCRAFKNFFRWIGRIFAPPRLQALRGSRGRPLAPGAPGEAVRAYALHLAADKTTTFAQNVENFISCTIESKETCPHVVMRNMRQFMSGMKNYLVKHGEREFEKEVEKERLKLKANEFLNLDAILEGVLHGAVVTPLRSHIYGLLVDKFAKRGDVSQLTMGMRIAKTLPPLRLGIRPSVKIPTDAEMFMISQYFVRMQEADSPLDKLENLLSAISAIFNAMKAGSSTSAPLGADDFLPVLVMILARCNVAGAELEAELMAGLLPPPLLAGEGGYYLTTLFGAVAVLKKLASSDDQNKSLDWRTGSVGTGLVPAPGCGVSRVLVPDENSGALRYVSLPWRPGARARDLCRQLAHRARITNPQDYGLFALRDGEETLINDTDYPQDLVENNKGNCMLAYKRIDAKIAWPKQALQSYP